MEREREGESEGGREGGRAAHHLPGFPGNYVARGGSIQSNHPELMRQNPTHLALSVIMWVEKVRGGAKCLNHPALVQKHPAYLVFPVTR